MRVDYIKDISTLCKISLLFHVFQIIHNPPYQADVANEGDRANPVYDKFMDAAYEVADCVELIHPARFLFNAGQTSKAWNQKMLNDDHFKVLEYEADASRVFSNTDIKGGVAISLRDVRKTFGAIKTFAKYTELNSILQKVVQQTQSHEYFDSLVSSRGQYRFSDKFYEDHPEAVTDSGSGNMVVSNAFDALSHVFIGKKSENSDTIAFIGRTQNARQIRYIQREYIIPNDYIDAYKVMMAEANGTGQFGETLSQPMISSPGEGATDTFISIGPFATKEEAAHALSYVKTKFARALLGVNKATQHNPRSVWKSIPLQDFTSASDIDWLAPIKAIDQQLYKKYNLSEEEISFIETHVKEMV